MSEACQDRRAALQKRADGDFYVLRRGAAWVIQAGGNYFGSYENPARALPMAIRVAREAALAGMRTRVHVVEDSGLERVVWPRTESLR